jgi:hypothetical protein
MFYRRKLAIFLKPKEKKGKLMNKRFVAVLAVIVFIGISLCFASQAAAAALPVINIDQTDQQIELQPEQPVGQIFIAPVDSFGSLEIRFNNYFLQDELYVIFRIKEAGAEDWYYQNTYGAKDFYNGWFYPFGFPVISNAEEKEFYFELEIEPGQLEINEQSHLSIYQNAQGEINFRLLADKSYKEFAKQVMEDFIDKIRAQAVFFALYDGLMMTTSAYLISGFRKANSN